MLENNSLNANFLGTPPAPASGIIASNIVRGQSSGGGIIITAAPAVPSAIENLSEPVARLWCRSFGVTSPAAIARLKRLLQTRAQDVFAEGLSFDQVQTKLDQAAEAIIRVWFTLVLDRAIAPTAKALAIVRLAFLDSNYENRWSEDFLSDTVPVQELAAELNASMPEPTPIASPLAMSRQTI